MLLFSAIEAYPRQPSSQSPLRGQYISSFLNASSKRTPRLQPPPYSPQDDLRIRFQTQSNRLHWLRVFIACTTLVLSTACIVCAGRSLHEYSKTQATPNLDPPLWSSGLDVRPAQTVLGCSSLVAVAGLGINNIIVHKSSKFTLRRNLHRNSCLTPFPAVNSGRRTAAVALQVWSPRTHIGGTGTLQVDMHADHCREQTGNIVSDI
ncbi:hypothetical protein MMC24_003722 [Lignoscripta atroalba]|nr:hypothetical protein [Lignoscripta atroalba]